MTFPRCAMCKEPQYFTWLIHGDGYCRPCARQVAINEKWKEVWKW